MKGDFTRSTFNPEKHYSSVRMQQGRLQLDADWNEQVDILAHLNQVQIKDLIGISGVPKNNNDQQNYKISPLDPEQSLQLEKQNFKISPLEPEQGYFEISPGQIYVDGILCQLEEPKSIPTTYRNQPDYPNALEEDLGKEDLPQGDYIVYLDVWQRHVTSVDDPQIREVALGNVPDTATRTKTVWQVKLLEFTNNEEEKFLQRAQEEWKRFLQQRKKDNISLTPKVSDVANLENHLYRVEIHQGGAAGKATFKWSRDNGFVVSAIEKIDGNIITIPQNNDETWQLARPRQWLEIIRSDRELAGKPGILVRLQRVSGNKLIIDLASIKEPSGLKLPDKFEKTDQPGSGIFKIRLWDYTIDTLEAGISVNADNDSGYISLEGEGIEVKFKVKGDGNYQTGDYWLIPTRKNSRNSLDWPINGDDSSTYQDLPPHGIKHHYSCLALIKLNDKKKSEVWDCRQTFPSLINCLDGTDFTIGSLQVQGQIPKTLGKGTIASNSENSDDVTVNYFGDGFSELDVGESIVAQNQARTIQSLDSQRLRLTVNQSFTPVLEESEPGKGQPFSSQKPLVHFSYSREEPDEAAELIFNSLGLEVKGKIKTTELELPLQGTFEAGTFKSKNLELGIRQDLKDPDTFLDYGLIQAEEVNGNKQISFKAQNQSSFAFLKGQVLVGETTVDEELLKVNGAVGAVKFRSQGLELIAGTSQDPNTLLDYGLIQAEEVDGSKQISFTAENNVRFAFINGKVVVGEPTNSDGLLNVGGLVSANQFTGNGSELTGITAEQVGALVSVDGVSNAGGDIDLIASNAITIEPNNNTNQITISETHSRTTNNPHQVTAEQVGAIANINDATPTAGKINLVEDNAIAITSVPATNQITIGETHSRTTNNPHQVTAEQVGAVSTEGGTIEGLLTLLDNLSVNGNVALGTAQATASLQVQGSEPETASGTISGGDLVTVTGNGTSFTAGQQGSLLIAANEIRGIREVLSATEVTVDLPFSESLSEETFAIVPVVQDVTISHSSTSQTTIKIDDDIPEELSENDIIIAAGQIRTVTVTESSNEFTIDIPFKEPLQDSTPFAILQSTASIEVSGWDEQAQSWNRAIARIQGQFPNLAQGDFVIAAGQLRTVEAIDVTNNSFIVTPPFREPLPLETNLFILPQESGTITTEITVTGDANVDFNQLYVDDLISAAGQTSLITGISVPDKKLTISAPFDSSLTNEAFSYQQPIARFVDSNKKTQLIINAEGNVGIGTSIPTAKLQVDGPVRINDDLWCKGTLLQSSSLTLKTNIVELSRQEANQILRELNPIKFHYKEDRFNHPHIGFIAEDVPDLVASSDKKAICPVDIVAVLTKTVQYHEQTISQLTNLVNEQKHEIATLQDNLTRLSGRLQKKQRRKKLRRLTIRAFWKQVKRLYSKAVRLID